MPMAWMGTVDIMFSSTHLNSFQGAGSVFARQAFTAPCAPLPIRQQRGTGVVGQMSQMAEPARLNMTLSGSLTNPPTWSSFLWRRASRLLTQCCMNDISVSEPMAIKNSDKFIR